MSEFDKASAMLAHAEEFRRAEITLYGNEWDMSAPKDLYVAIPQAVLNAFACELYFKFLIFTQTGKEPRRTHNLKALFGDIPSDVQAKIRHYWDNPKPGQLIIRQQSEQLTGKPYGTFDEHLEASALGFERLRYSYEYENEALNCFCTFITECARYTVFAIYPTEYAHVRLPLPPSAVPMDKVNTVRVGTKPPRPTRPGFKRSRGRP